MQGRSRTRGRGARWALALLAASAASLGLLAAAGPSAAAEPATIYSVSKGCYSLAPASTGQPVAIASSQRFQATKLGSYLLYGTAKDFLSLQRHQRRPGRPAEPREATGS